MKKSDILVYTALFLFCFIFIFLYIHLAVYLCNCSLLSMKCMIIYCLMG